MSRPSSNSKAGFSLVELLVAMAIVGILLALVSAVLASTLTVKKRETQLLEVQQNARAALQLISQDLRAGAFLHVWHDPDCPSSAVCSSSDRIAVITTDGTMTTIAEPPGNSYNNSSETGVCDASAFRKGDIALIFNSGSVDMVEVTKTQELANPDKPCSSVPNPNRDKIQHNKDKLTGQWSASSYMYRAVVASYSLQPDPLEPDKTVLYRRTGLSTEQAQSGIVAFNVSGLSFAYGVPVDPSASASKLEFYPTLESAAAALGSDYSAYPRTSGKVYVGNVVKAVRISLTGETTAPLPQGDQLGHFTLTETVELRR